MRIVLLGAGGQIGVELRRALAPLGEVIIPARCDFDLDQPLQLRQALVSVAPDVIVNAAAYTAVDAAETDRERASRINAEAPRAIGEAARQTRAFVVHYSTDYVFSGQRVRPYREDDPTDPLSVYGQTKRNGEIGLINSGAAFYLFRTAWVVSPRGRNFLRTILRLARERDGLTVVDDQIGAPTPASLIADVTAHGLRQRLSRCPDAPAAGVYHLTAAGSASWYDVACHIVAHASGVGLNLRLEAGQIKPIKTAAYGQIAPRPANSQLDTTRLTTDFGLVMPDWRDGIQWILEQLQ